MTNEEKAKDLAKKWSTDAAYNRAKITAIEMAEWKDQQFKEYMEKKLDFLKGRAMVSERNLLKEIINELFKED